MRFAHPPRHYVESSAGEVALSTNTRIGLASADAFGRSGDVRVVFALPGEPVRYPVELRSDPSVIAYAWVPLADTTRPQALSPEATRPLADGIVAPDQPGFYRLGLATGDERGLVPGPVLSVMVPFAEKLGGTLNGYRIGTYIAERLGVPREEPPPGFVPIDETVLNLPLTTHLRLGDFVSHDDQPGWPRYAALDVRLLDKIELVLEELAKERGRASDEGLTIDVHSGFRTPLHNRRVQRAARDSRHQYGDAADIAIDSNGDGRLSFADTRLIARAVEVVEREHPELAGGMGLYNRGSASYVHIDARGQRARWRG